jgi:aspartate/glutamate racemase
VLIDRGAEVIVLSGTDLFLAFDDNSLSIDAIDCAEVHIKHLLELAAPESKL